MKLANPLYYPLSVLAGAIVLVTGVRLANLPSVVVVPLAVAISVGGATLQKAQTPKATLENPALERELQSTRQQARELAAKANSLRQESTRLLTDSVQMDLLVAVQAACDRALELPARIDELARRMQGADSLLEASDLQQQLTEAETRLRSSSGVAQEQLARLVESLCRNIHLAQQGQDARQAQVVSLSTLILDSAGVLQAMQNQLRSANLTDNRQTEELRSLSNELSGFQENIALLVSR
ncbi:MAG TPA: hypothetical protein V6D18_12520 [Thermosynechococcaceae cyanobacterium]